MPLHSLDVVRWPADTVMLQANLPLQHFGLGQRKLVDIEVVLPHGKGNNHEKVRPANQRITMP